jgi:hypothetical protein
MEVLSQYWQIIVTAVGIAVWGIRLEGQVKSVSNETKRLETQRSADLQAAEKSREATNAMLVRMDDKIERNFQEVRSDIKNLIRQVPSE